METAIVASDHITISISLIWTVIGSLASAIGVLLTVIGTMYKKSREDQKLFADTILSYTTQVLKVTMDNSNSNSILTKTVQELPDRILMMLQKIK